jgi:hypothetical protein
MRPTYPCRQGLKIPKGRGEYSMSGKGASKQSYLAQPRQHKVCMVKARLLEPQSSRLQTRRQRRIADKLFWRVIGHSRMAQCKRGLTYYFNPRSSLSSVPAMCGMKGTNGEPNHTASHHAVNTGSPTLVRRDKRPPVWRRSPHSTQGWLVMSSADDAVASDGQRGINPVVTRVKAWLTGGKGAASMGLRPNRTRGRADATRYSK